MKKKPKIAIFFRGTSISYVQITPNKMPRLVGIIDYEGTHHLFTDRKIYPLHYRDYNKTIVP